MTARRTVFGLMEISELLDVGLKTPHAWQRRGLLPPADHDVVNGNKAWNRDTIIAWAARTGRLPDDLTHEAVALGETNTAPYRGGRAAKAEVRKLYGD